MKAGHKRSRFTVAAILVIAVISLAFTAGAAAPPLISTQPTLEKGLQTPLKMALDANGDIYVADPRSGGVVQLDQYGAVKQIVETPAMATAVAVLNPLVSNITGGKLLIAMGDRVAVYDKSGVEIAKLGSGNGQFVRVAGIAVDAAGNIYVTDTGAYCVKIFSSSGSFIKSFGTFGAPPTAGAFKQPTAISVVTVAGGQQLAVVDSVNGNIQFFTTDGAYIKTVGASGGPGPLSFSTPVGIAFQHVTGVAVRMYVLDGYQGNVQAVDVSVEPASFLSNIGSYGYSSGQLLTPSDLVYDQSNNRLLVSNGMSNIVSYGVDGGSNPVNSTPPTLTVSQSSVSVVEPTVTLSGSVEIGATIASSVNTLARATAASFPSASSWMLTVSNLVPGVNIVSITAANKYGITATKTVTVTYVPPAVQLSLDSYATLTGQPVIALSGTAEAGSAVTVYNGATKIIGQASVVDTTWNYSTSLLEGSNAITVTAVKASKSSVQRDLIIELDSLAPAIHASLPGDGTASSTQVLNVSGTVADAHLASCSVNGTPAVLTDGQFNTAVSLNLGDNIITITAVDQLGNKTTDSRVIVFNPELPQIVIQSPVDGLVTNAQNVLVDIKADVASVTVNGQASASGQPGVFATTVKLATGLNTIIINAIDQFGRAIQEKRTVTYDAVAPVVTIASPAQDVAINTPGTTITGLISDNNAIRSVRATVNGNDAPVTINNGSFSLFAEFKQEGAYTVAITVDDSANNSSTAFRTLLFDVTPPIVTVDPVLSPIPAVLSGTVEQGSTVVVSDSDKLRVPAVMTGTVWTADLKGITYDAATLAVSAMDAAGNTSFKSVMIPVPDGDLDGDGAVTIRDAYRALKLIVSNNKPTQYELDHGDVGPLLNGKRNPNGKLDLFDVILIHRKSLGLPVWK